ncbi:MAG: hypothetical protein ACRD3O_17870 [Terriglobia bacterium]
MSNEKHRIARGVKDPQPEARCGKKTRPKRSPKRPADDALTRNRCSDVKELPQALREIVDQMLTEGSTFEDTVQAVRAPGGKRITLAAVETYFRSNLPLQRDRIRRLLQISDNLKSAFANPESAQAGLAEAILLMGLLGLRKQSAASEVQHAIRAKEQKENVQLKEDAFRLKLKRSSLELEIMEARLRADDAKLQLAASKLAQFKRTLEREQGATTLSAEMLQRIQEVYGIVSDGSQANS